MKNIALRVCMLFSFVLLQTAVQAANTLILNGEVCGAIDNMVIEQASVSDYSVQVTGATGCSVSGSADDTGAVILPYSSLDLTVTGGDSGSVDVITGVTAILPVKVILEQIPDESFGSTVKNDNTGAITFIAKAAADNITGLTISFHLQGNDGSISDTADINLTINKGGTSTTGECVDAGNIVCKGTNSRLVTGGNIQDIAIARDTIHVWEFRYQNNAASGAETFWNLDPSVEALSHLEIDFTINQNPGNMNVGVNGQSSCINKHNVIGISSYEKSNYCHLAEGQTYFLNMRNLGRKDADNIVRPTQGYYTLVR